MLGEKEFTQLEQINILVEKAYSEKENIDGVLLSLLEKKHFEIVKEPDEASFFRLYPLLKQAEDSTVAKLTLTQWHLQGVKDCLMPNVNSAYAFFERITQPSEKDSETVNSCYSNLKQGLISAMRNRTESCLESIKFYTEIAKKEKYVSYAEKCRIPVFLESQTPPMLSSYFLISEKSITRFLDGIKYTLPMRVNFERYQKIYSTISQAIKDKKKPITETPVPTGYSSREWQTTLECFNNVLFDNIRETGKNKLENDVKEAIHCIIDVRKMVDGKIDAFNLEDLLKLIKHSNQENIHWEQNAVLASIIESSFKNKILCLEDGLDVLFLTLSLDEKNEAASDEIKKIVFNRENIAFDFLYANSYTYYFRLFDAYKKIGLELGSPFKDESEQQKFFMYFSDNWNLEIVLEAINRKFLSVHSILSAFFDAQKNIESLISRDGRTEEVRLLEKNMLLFYRAIDFFMIKHKEIKNDFKEKETFLLFSKIIEKNDCLTSITERGGYFKNEKEKIEYITLGEIFHQQKEFEKAVDYYSRIAKNDIDAFEKMIDICSGKERVASILNADVLCSVLKYLDFSERNFLRHFYSKKSEIERIENIRNNLYQQIGRCLYIDKNYLFFRQYFKNYNVECISDKESERSEKSVFDFLNLEPKPLYAKLGLIAIDLAEDRILKAVTSFRNLEFSVDEKDLVASSDLILKLCFRYILMKREWNTWLGPIILDGKILAHFVAYFRCLFDLGALNTIEKKENRDMLMVTILKLTPFYYDKGYSSQVSQLTWLYLLCASNEKQAFETAFKFCKQYNEGFIAFEARVTNGTDVIEIKKNLVKEFLLNKGRVNDPAVGKANTDEQKVLLEDKSKMFEL